MNRKAGLFHFVSLATVLVVASAFGIACADYSYTLLGYPLAYGINDTGQIVGMTSSGTGFQQSLLCSGSSCVPVDFSNDDYGTYAHGINNAGEVVGFYRDANGIYHGFLRTGSTYLSFDYSGANMTYAYAINNAGQIVGGSDNGGFLLTGLTFTPLNYPSPDTYGTTAYGINDLGQIVGSYYDGNGNEHGFLLTGSTWMSLDFPGAYGTSARGINNLGQIVGSYADTGGGNVNGFLYYNGSYTPLDYHQGSTSLNGINNERQIVGYSTTGGGFLASPIPVSFAIDIIPGDDSNTINLHSMKSISVAILSTADFSAPSEVDRTTLTFGATGNEKSFAGCARKQKDVNGDHLIDLICTFSAETAGFQCGDAEGILKGRMGDGTPFEQWQAVTVTHCH